MASSLIQPTPIPIPWASVGNKRAIPTESQILEVGGDGKASYPDGYPPLCGTPLASGGKPPSILDENGILFDITSNLRFIQAGGTPKFNADIATAINGYPVGAKLQDNDGVNTYINIVDGNSVDFNTSPSSIGVSWFLCSAGVQPGDIIWTAKNVAPFGTMKANGAAVSRTTYSRLFSVIGTAFGTGNGTTTFNLPDLRGEFVRGWDDSRGIDVGRAFGSAQSQATSFLGTAINGASAQHVMVSTPRMPATPVTDSIDGIPSSPDGAFNDGGASSISRLSGSTETRPRNIALLACIKY